MSELDPGLLGYLTTNRDFMDPAVARAVDLLDLPAGATVLDVGTGAGGALPHLARAVGTAGTVIAVDRDPAVLDLAAAHIDRLGMASRIVLRAADVRDLIADAAVQGGAFDAIWASEVIWPGNFEDPPGVVREMAAALRPGGVLALLSTNYYRATFLPGYSRLERVLRTASELRWRLPGEGPHHTERQAGWLLDAGLADVGMHVLPRAGFPDGTDPTIRPYLEAAVWPELLQSAAACGREAGLSDAELDDVRTLLTPGSGRYIMDEPGFHIIHPAVLVTGRRWR